MAELKRELESIAAVFQQKPPGDPENAFEHARAHRAGATTLYHCFHNADGENLFDAKL